LAKIKGISHNKVYCFAGLVKNVGNIIADKLLWSYRTSTQQKQRKKTTYGKVFNNKTLFATVPPTKHYSRYSTPWQNFQQMRLLSAKAKYNYHKKTTSCPNRKHRLLQVSLLTSAIKAYIRQNKSKQKAEQNLESELERQKITE